jgi:hypothetical protein
MRTVHRSLARSAPVALAALLLVVRSATAQVSVGGVVYTQFGYGLAKDTLAADSAIQHINNFDITRAYINVNGRFPGGISTRVTADIFNSGGSRLYRLKYAYVAWTPDSSHMTFVLGQLHTPLLDWEEALWDYRMQGQMAMERGGYVSSSDFGIRADGKWAADRLNFQAGVYNGENYSGGPGDNRKDIMGRVSLRLANSDDMTRVGGLRLTFYGQVGQPNTGGRRNRFLGMVSYKSTNLTLAAEYAITEDSLTGGNTAPGGGTVAAVNLRKGRVISAYGVFHFPQTRFAVIGRVDVNDPQTDSTAAVPGVDDQLVRYIVGGSYQLTPNVRLLGDVDIVSFESGFVPTAGNYAAYVGRSTAYFHVQFTF